VRLDDIDPGWAAALSPVAENLEGMREFLEREDAAGRDDLPAPENVLRAFERPFDAVRVLIVGQDPYPTPGHPIGLAFAVERHVRPLPRSLANIYRELHDDLGIDPPPNGDLSPWSEQGVLLLNRVLTVRPGQAGSHRGLGWEQITTAAVGALAARGGPLVAVLWGNQAQTLAPLLAGIAVLESAHPSPLSAARGFFGSTPFSRVNESLSSQGAAPIEWRITG
jgi:uracil-DNA glycosylase